MDPSFSCLKDKRMNSNGKRIILHPQNIGGGMVKKSMHAPPSVLLQLFYITLLNHFKTIIKPLFFVFILLCMLKYQVRLWTLL